ncbi:hypothetical protein [Tenacibaculum bernardetii]|uniref:hypothetical protein n=1 Tax=Tenacibaculum bernardetii TaxID=3021375 RepID=UPI0023AF2C7C|nr:hypothetical protein [Tenacibaculum bernardetii]
MATTEQLFVNNTTFKFSKFNFISVINSKIAQEESNAFVISIVLLMASSMIASFSAALAVHGEVNLFALVITCISAMGANAVAISQRSLKTVVWSFFFAVLANIALIIYQLIL